MIKVTSSILSDIAKAGVIMDTVDSLDAQYYTHTRLYISNSMPPLTFENHTKITQKALSLKMLRLSAF